MSGVAATSHEKETAPLALDRDSAASYHLTLWDQDCFIHKVDHHHHQPLQQVVEESEHEVLKEEVRKMVTADHDDDDDLLPEAIANKLRLIDAIQRLGVGHHFEAEIEAALEKIHGLGDQGMFIGDDDDHNIDLYHAALRFRLLRQQGLHVSSDGFRKLKDREGTFKESLASDEQGLLSLYEAAHVAVNGEDILDEALSFATKVLRSILPCDNRSPNSFLKQVNFALSLPVWKCVPRSLARHYIDFYSEDASCSHDTKLLLKFAKLDFNMLQKFHQQELHEIYMWWKSLQVTTKFPYARDRLVECYYWIYAVYFEPKYQLARTILTKIISMLSLLDDTYDNNIGTDEDVKIFTEAIQRWDARAPETLPEPMKNLLLIIINLYDEFEMELAKVGPTFAVEYAKEELKTLCKFHLAEIEWCAKGYVPTLEEYKIIAYGTSGFFTLCTCSFVGIEAKIATREAFEWVSNKPKMVSAGTVICRLQNDIVSHQFEQKRKHAASAIECYMKEHTASEEEAVEYLWGEISRAWKDIAEECQKPTPFPVALTDRILNFARSIVVIYEKGDGYTNSHLLKAHIASLFLKPVPV